MTIYFHINFSHISRVRVVKKEGVLDVCVDDIVCENVKEAEHLASTLALYHLCKGQVSMV